MKFQYIFLTFFGVMAVIAVVALAHPGQKSNPSVAGAHGSVAIWGTFPYNENFSKVVKDFNDEYHKSFTVNYTFHDPKTFDNDLVEALANGQGPDIVLLPDDLILRHENKIEPIPYTSVTERLFKDTFVQASEIYMRDNGILALPYAIDPMIMYWNRSLFNSASITEPPKYWDEFLTMAPRLTKRTQSGTITQSAISFGEFANVVNAKDILAMLFLQVGNPIVSIENGRPKAYLTTAQGDHETAASDVVSALRFFMDFSNPLESIYSWSRALPNSRDQFLSGKLAVYFDFASAYNELKDENPHLDFDVAPVPLPRSNAEIAFAHVYGLAVLKNSPNKQTAFIAVQRLLDPKYAGDFAAGFNLPPVRRDLLGIPQTDAVRSVLYYEAIRAKTWLDPKPGESDVAFQSAVEAVSSGRLPPDQSVFDLQNQLTSLLRPYQ